MILRFRSKALKLAMTGDPSKIAPPLRQRVVLILDALNDATSLTDLESLPGFHVLIGNRAGEFSVRITGNFRITFTPVESEVEESDLEEMGKESSQSYQETMRFDVTHVDFEDYH